MKARKDMRVVIPLLLAGMVEMGGGGGKKDLLRKLSYPSAVAGRGKTAVSALSPQVSFSLARYNY